MNDFVLRGFCKKCGSGICMEKKNAYSIHAPENENWFIFHLNPYIKKHLPEPVWFLSSKQMKIVFGSDEFEKWAGQENYFELCNNAFTLIVKVLEDNPFLVSKILKEAEEKREVKKE